MASIFQQIKADFPILKQTNRGKPLVYLDSAASAQKPQVVIDAISHFYQHDYANIHRGIYELSVRATDLYENTRQVVQEFINAKSPDEIIYVRGTTEGINLVADSIARCFLKRGDEVLISELEHHSNIVPWYLLQEKYGIKLKVVPITDQGEVDLTAYRQAFSVNTKFVAISHASNALGTINPIKEMVAIAHEHGAKVLVDGAQAIPHMPVDVQDLDCDFYVFSGHKIYGPTGIGVLYGKKAWLTQMPPYQGGGDMIETVAFDKITFAKVPHKFEAGTPDIAGVIGLQAALHYVKQFGMQKIYTHEQQLLHYATQKLLALPGLRMIGTAGHKVGVMSFIIDGIHPHDIGTVLDNEGIAVRAGHHCAMPVMTHFKIPATVRASIGIYNNEADIDALIDALQLAMRFFA